MKKIIGKICILGCLIAVVFGISSCASKDKTSLDQFKLSYIAQEGGYVYGNISQTIAEGGSSSEVTAKPFEGYKFIEWSDNNSSEPIRTDKNVTKDITATAVFEKISLKIEYKINEEYITANGFTQPYLKGRIDG